MYINNVNIPYAISFARAKLLFIRPIFGFLTMPFEPKENKDIELIEFDNYYLYYNINDKTNQKELIINMLIKSLQYFIKDESLIYSILTQYADSVDKQYYVNYFSDEIQKNKDIALYENTVFNHINQLKWIWQNHIKYYYENDNNLGKLFNKIENKDAYTIKEMQYLINLNKNLHFPQNKEEFKELMNLPIDIVFTIICYCMHDKRFSLYIRAGKYNELWEKLCIKNEKLIHFPLKEKTK